MTDHWFAITTTLWSWLGSLVITAGGAAAITIGIFRYFGKSWLDSQFAKRLETHKHAQQRELERLRFQISSLLDRTVKIHQREFDVLPEVWAALVEARRQVDVYTSSYRRYPTFFLLSEEDVDRVLEASPLHDFQKDKVREAENRQEVYSKLIDLHERERCRSSLYDCQTLLRKDGIFFQKPMHVRFDEALDMMWKAYFEREQNFDLGQFPWQTDCRDKFEAVCSKLMDELEGEVRDRLWSYNWSDESRP